MPITTFLRLLDTDDKAAALLDAVHGHAPQRVFHTDPYRFSQIPTSTFAYWVGDNIRSQFTQWPGFGSDSRPIKQGLATADDFQFVRAFWEVRSKEIIFSPNEGRESFHQEKQHNSEWANFAKGGAFSMYYSDIYLVVNWKDNGKKIKQRINPKTDLPYSNVWQLKGTEVQFFFQPGITWSRRSQKGFSVRILPEGCIFSDKGPSAFSTKQELPSLLSLLNSNAFQALLALQMSFGSYEVGVIQRTPVPDLNNPDGERLGELALACVHLKRNLDTANEISHVFHLPALLQVRGETLADRAAAWAKNIADSEAQLAANQREIDEIAFKLYGIEGEDRRAIEESLNHRGTEAQSAEKDDDEEAGESISANDQTSVSLRLCGELTSYLVGLPFGRWDIRYATGERSAPELPDPFAPLPVCPPGMLQNAQGLPAAPEDVPTSYPLRISWHGILVDDAGHAEDIAGRVREAIRVVVSRQWSVVSGQSG